MREHLDRYRQWWTAQTPFILVTITAVRRSAPLPPGQTMAFGPAHETMPNGADDLEVVGSVSGGCVESDILYRALDMLRSGSASETAEFGFSDESAFAHGLTCGGELEVLLERVDRRHYPSFGGVLDQIETGNKVTIGSTISPGAAVDRTVRIDTGTLEEGTPTVSKAIAAFDSTDTGPGDAFVFETQGEERSRVFVRTYTPPPRLLIFGAIDYAAALSKIGLAAQYRVTVCDARATFATDARFPDVDELVVDWPVRYFDDEVAAGRVDERTAVCVLTHDLKFDIPLLVSASRANIGYIGAMGSRRTHDERAKALEQTGELTMQQITQIHSPIGLDLGARTASGTAVSIMAEVLAVRHGGHGVPLSQVSTPIHRHRQASSKVLP